MDSVAMDVENDAPITTCPSSTLCTALDGGVSYCANTQTDNANCGTCGNVCGGGTACSNGVCKVTCGTGATLCSLDGGAGYCANLQTDNNNCGSCGNQCVVGSTGVSMCTQDPAKLFHLAKRQTLLQPHLPQSRHSRLDRSSSGDIWNCHGGGGDHLLHNRRQHAQQGISRNEVGHGKRRPYLCFRDPSRHGRRGVAGPILVRRFWDVSGDRSIDHGSRQRGLQSLGGDL